MKIKKVVEVGVLVAGGGGAGERAALEAARSGASVAIALKGRLALSGCTARAVSELSAFSAAIAQGDPRDNAYLHFHDTVYQGNGLSNEELARIFVQGAKEIAWQLAEEGVPFRRDGKGRPVQLLADASTVPRALTCGADTGREIANLVKQELLEQPGVEIYENVMITGLLKNKGTVCGAVGLDTEDGQVIVFRTPSVVLATGGGCCAYTLSAQPPEITGDGLALSARAGAKLVNMEFIQFGPAMVYPIIGYLLVTSFWRLNPRIYNGKGEEFLSNYLPEGLNADDVIRAKQFAFPFIIEYPAMYLDIAIHSEVFAGRGSEHGGVYLDISHNDAETIKKEVPVSYQWLLERGIDITKQPLEIAPVAQCFIGGVAYDRTAETDVPGLFVCGELSGGLHGAARPGGNLLCISQVFGKIAGQSAARRAAPVAVVQIDEAELEQELSRMDSLIGAGKPAAEVIRKLQAVMWEHVAIVRNEEGLRKALAEIERLRAEEWPQVAAADGKELRSVLELDCLLDVAKYVAISSLERKESRGTFYRSDYPARNNQDWLKVIELSQEGGRITSARKLPKKIENFDLE